MEYLILGQLKKNTLAKTNLQSHIKECLKRMKFGGVFSVSQKSF